MMQTEVGNKRIILINYNDHIPKETDFEPRHGKKIQLQAPKGSGAFLVKNLYLSSDPYLTDFHHSYLPPFSPGSVIEGFGVSRVVDSDNSNFKPGDLIYIG